MLFTAPMFVFLFLPLSLLSYLVFGKRHKRLFLACVCLAFHLLFNLYRPHLLLVWALMILYTWLGGKAVMRYRKSLFVFLVCALPYLGLIALRNLAYSFGNDAFYAVGMTVAAMSSTSYLLEAVRDNIKKRDNLFDLSFYMLFFPTMIVGPLISYPDFLRMTEESRLEINQNTLADGIFLFAKGFIKRIAVGALLIDAFEEILGRFSDSPDLLLGLFLLVLIYFGVYFTVSGYSDMGCGIARMFGVRIRHVATTPFGAATFDEYLRNLFLGLTEWLENYVKRPLLRLTNGRFPYAVHAVAYGVCVSLILRPSLYVLLLAVPMMGAEYLCARLQAERRLNGRGGLRFLFTLGTMLVISAVWIFIVLGDISSVWEYVLRMTYENSEYHTDLLLVTFSGKRYLAALLMAVVLLLPELGLDRLMRRLSPKRRAGVQGGYMCVILVLFLVTVLLFLPHYGCYNAVPFRYLYI